MISPAKCYNRPCPICIISTDAELENPNKIFLGGIPSQATEKQLEEFFSEYGKVKDVRIVTDRVTAESKGYGFVTFDASENVDHLVEKKAIRMYGKKLRVRKAIRRNGSQFEHLNPSPPKRQPAILVPIGQRINSGQVVTPSYQVTQQPCYQPLTPPASPDHMKPARERTSSATSIHDYPRVVLPPVCTQEFVFPPYVPHGPLHPAILQDFSSCLYMPSPTPFLQPMHSWPIYQGNVSKLFEETNILHMTGIMTNFRGKKK